MVVLEEEEGQRRIEAVAEEEQSTQETNSIKFKHPHFGESSATTSTTLVASES